MPRPWTSVANRWARVADGSLVRPVCTGEAWTIVLLGETSQWKRSGRLSAAIGPAEGSPAQIRGNVSSWAWTTAGSHSGASARRTARSSPIMAAR